MDWKDKTCEKCEYRDEGICRRFPPQREGMIKQGLNYVLIEDAPRFSIACAEYKSRIGEVV